MHTTILRRTASSSQMYTRIHSQSSSAPPIIWLCAHVAIQSSEYCGVSIAHNQPQTILHLCVYLYPRINVSLQLLFYTPQHWSILVIEIHYAMVDGKINRPECTIVSALFKKILLYYINHKYGMPQHWLLPHWIRGCVSCNWFIASTVTSISYTHGHPSILINILSQ